MAIINHPPFDCYTSGTDWCYLRDNNKWSFNRPGCISNV